MPLTSGKLGPLRTWPVEVKTRTTPVPPSVTAAGRVDGDDVTGSKLSAPVASRTRQVTTPRVRAGSRIRSAQRRCPPRPPWPVSAGATGRSSTTCGTLADLDPARDRRYAGGKDEQHVPARRGVVAVQGRGRGQPVRPVGRGGEVDITLVKVVGVRHRARP